MEPPDHFDIDRFSALGAHPCVIVDVAKWSAPEVPVQAVIIGCDWQAALPDCDVSSFDLLLTAAKSPPSPWVNANPADCEAIEARIRQWPMSATILCQTLKVTEQLPFDDGLFAESLAYSCLLGGTEFKRWNSARQGETPSEPAEVMRIEREGDHVTLTLDNPREHNAMTAKMRDSLHQALAAILDDPTRPTVSLRGAGKCFSTGGSILEFGTATDLAQAHIIRTIRSCARLIEALGDRIDVHFHGAVVGSGLEVAASASRRTACPKSWFQLPELQMGLILGAGGTVTVSRAIGRHRAAWMVLSGKRIPAKQALDWGLIHSVSEDQ
jgi:enoyl-CoA hydratase/carnithine racemase